jgi:hypothetical protein
MSSGIGRDCKVWSKLEWQLWRMPISSREKSMQPMGTVLKSARKKSRLDCKTEIETRDLQDYEAI